VRTSLSFCWLGLGLLVIACGTPAAPPAPQAGAPTAASGPTNGSPQLAQLYEAARQEGEVIFESAQNTETMQPLIDRFSQKYPGVRVSYANRTPGETVERIVAEVTAGRLGIDASSSSLRTVLPLADRDLMTKVDWKALVPDLPDAALMLDARFVAWYHLPNVMAYNTTLANSAQLPKQWEDLLAPRWQGRKMILDARGVGLEHLAFLWGEERAYEFIGKLKAQNPILVPRSSVSIERVAAGEAALGGSVFPNVFEYQDKGAPVDWVRLPAYGVSTFGLYVTEGSPHPNAARLWVAFLLSEEGRRVYEDTAYYSFVFPGTNTRMERALREANVQLWFEDSVEVARQRGANQREIQRLLGGLQ
jgi:iron(III) transport system substrate-binding protein